MDDFALLKQQFTATFPDKAQALESALAQQDVSALTTKLHQLAGSSGSYGFNDMATLCATIEQLIQEVQQLNPAINDQIQALIQMLRAHQPTI